MGLFGKSYDLEKELGYMDLSYVQITLAMWRDQMSGYHAEQAETILSKIDSGKKISKTEVKEITKIMSFNLEQSQRMSLNEDDVAAVETLKRLINKLNSL